MRANLYIDGFNLYGSAMRSRFPDCKWLNVRLLAELRFPFDQINRVRYFTARVSARPDDPQQPMRQQAYLRALSAVGVEIHYGQFRNDHKFMRRVEACPMGGSCPTGDTVEVHKTEEKGSDVNLGTYLVFDAAQQECELAIVVTNDTDLTEPMRLLREEMGVRIALFSPTENPAKDLIAVADIVKKIRRGLLEQAQLPTNLRDQKGDIHRPRAWRP